MAQDVKIAGALFSNVPSISVPDNSDVYHSFYDVSDTTATAADVESGKYFYAADGTYTEGTGSGGGGAAIVVVDTQDAAGGTIREITAVDISSDTVDAAHLLQGYTAHDRTGQAITGSYTPSAPAILVTKAITANGTYDAEDDSADGYSEVTVNVPQGLIIPAGFAYYNGVLLPKIPVEEGYPYCWIRTNDYSGIYNVVYGKSQWRSRSAATLDNWQLEFATLSTDGAVYYAIANDGSETAWRDRTTSTNYFGLTTQYGRKVIWTSHDIKISTSANILMRACAIVE